MSKEVKSAAVMTRSETLESNRKLSDENPKVVKFAGIVVTEKQAIAINVLLGILFVSDIVLFLHIAWTNPSYNSNADLFMAGIYSFLAIPSIPVFGFCLYEEIYSELIEHDIYKDDIFKFQENKFTEAKYIRVIDCDYVKDVYLTETFLPKEQSHTPSNLPINDEPNINNGNQGEVDSKPKVVIMTSDDILKAGVLTRQFDLEPEEA